MSQPHHPHPFWRSVAFAVGLCALALFSASAKDSDPVKGADHRLQDEDPKAALIGLKNAIRKSPQDAAIRVKIARLYFQLGESRRPSARRVLDATSKATKRIICPSS